MARSQSYVLMLFVMMAWSLLYHSWLTFVLMIISCVVWMYPNSQRFCAKISPYIAFYAQALVLIQFIYSLDLTQAELPDENPDNPCQIIVVSKHEQIKTKLNLGDLQIGFEKPRTAPPCRSILLKFMFTVLFWITVKQRTIEKRRGEAVAGGEKKPDVAEKLTEESAKGAIEFEGQNKL
ncbi:unnamed protein product [Anisakis simplex]|uniref:Piezo-type mechanosensitive ion channel component n=1 Tax=Anisakis simplex TaxID=6269 RepID=A0A0M3J1V1_ANISI|nr:unnamed protein product [Anisakis simplex]